jgi:hypothetical protein
MFRTVWKATVFTSTLDRMSYYEVNALLARLDVEAQLVAKSYPGAVITTGWASRSAGEKVYTVEVPSVSV